MSLYFEEEGAVRLPFPVKSWLARLSRLPWTMWGAPTRRR